MRSIGEGRVSADEAGHVFWDRLACLVGKLRLYPSNGTTEGFGERKLA